MPTTTAINDSGLRQILTQLIEDRRRAPNLKIDEHMLNNIVREIGDGPFVSRAALRKQVDDATTPEQKLAIAKKGLDANETADVKKLLAHPSFQRMLEPSTENFLKAVIGAEPLNPALFGTGTGATTRVAATVTPETKAAVAEFRQIVQNPSQLRKYYDAAIGVGDPALKDKALALFDKLPKVTAATTADDMVATGLWSTKPRGIEKMQTSARYLPGRQLIVPAKVNTDLSSGRQFLAWDDNGVDALTYRATLVGENGNDFLVKIDGKDDPIAVPKTEVYKRNQPHVLEGDNITISGKQADYNSPLLKAKIAEAAIKMDDLVGRLDFTKRQAAPQGGGFLRTLLGRNNSAEDAAAIQRQCVGVIHDVIDMKYRKPRTGNDPGREGGRDVGRLAVKGVGVCTEQSAVMGALLAPFQDLIGIDIQMMSGGVYRNTDRSQPMDAQFRRFQSPAHGWIQVTYRPTMEMRIIDRTWQQKDKAADRAYSPGGDRYPTRYISAIPVADLEGTDVVMDGSVSVETFERQFGEAGRDDRSNHMSNRDDHQ